jgi:DNA-binding beta-propeller fold protein YncE
VGPNGTSGGALGEAWGIDVAPDGNVYVADTANGRVEKFSADGQYLSTLGGPGRGPGRFLTPKAVATDSAGDVYVADEAEPFPGFGGVRIQKFGPGGEFLTAWGNVPVARPARPQVTAAPPKRTARRSAAFRFRSQQEGVRFQCRLNGTGVAKKLGRWRGCVSPRRYAKLAPGRKVFGVRAIKGAVAGPATRRTWLIASPHGG